ncbi:hypothetical protein BDV11DRAFT_211866 [Aspergillus similis]
MTFRSRLRAHNPFHRRKNTGNAVARTEMVEDQEGTIHNLWSAAYDQLCDKERKVLSTVQNTTTLNDLENPPPVAVLISKVIHLTEKQYKNFQQRADRRLQESSYKVINMALSFKDIISTVAASDPTYHAASAWAIMSLRLTIAQNHYNLQSALFKSSEYLADILAQCAYIKDKIYTSSNNKIKGDLGCAIIRLYRAILHYAAQIQTAQDPSMGRKLLDYVTAITKHLLTKLKALVEKERDNISWWIRLVQYLHHKERSKDILDRFNLVNLLNVKGAFYNLYINQHEGFCLPDTHAKLLESKCIFWLNSMAGTGKSTITQTVAQIFSKNQQLGATFFFKKGEADCGDAKYLIPTITKQLSLNSSNSSTTIIVIDALDECKERDIPVILNLLPQLHKSKVDDHQDLDLYKLPNPVIKHNIYIFLKERFSMIRKSRGMTDNWPGKDTLDALVKRAVLLFIFAATACRFIEKGRHPEKRFKQLLGAQAATSGSQMDKIYQPVLNQLLTDNNQESHELLQEFWDIVVKLLTRLLHLPKQTISKILDLLHLVLNISCDSEAPVRILHLSFQEYLLTTKSKFYVNKQEIHRKIGLHCLCIIKDCLKRNICGLSSYAIEKDNINSQTVNQHLLPDLQYSCRPPFLKTNFLYWLEALSLMGVLSEAIGMMDMLQAAVMDTDPEILQFLNDGMQFFLRNTPIASTAPLQLYYSGLIFLPEQSVVRRTYSENIPKWICPLPQTLTGHSGSVNSTGKEMQTLTGHSGSVYSTIKLWDVKTGKELQTLTGYLDRVDSVAFSSDGSTLASGSNDNTIMAPGLSDNIIQGHPILSLQRHYNRSQNILDPQVTLSDHWISIAGEKLICLPPEYHQFKSSAVKGATIALGYTDGRVFVIGFHAP